MDKFKAIFRRKTRQPPEPTSNATTIPSQSSSDNVAPTAQNAPAVPLPPLTSNPTTIPAQPSSDNVIAPTAQNAPAIPLAAPVPPQKAFVKSKTLEKDIAVLSITYILADNPELKRLVHLIVAIHDKDEDDQLIGVLETCARFAVQLASIAETHPTEASEATTEFIATIEKINLEPNVLSLDTVARMVDDEIVKVKSSHPLLARGSDFGTSGRLSKVLTATIGAGITIFSVAKDASAVIPVPFVQSTIGGVVNLLNAVAQTRSNYDDMKQIEATAGEFVVSCAVICSDRTMEPSNELKRALNKFTKNCDELSKLNTLWRYLQNNVQKGTLQGIRTNLDSAIKLFQTESQIHMQLDIKDISKKLDDATLNSLPNHPRYDAVDYLDKSRDDALQHISAWIDKPEEAILWIHGAAGLGKSTTGQQLVRLLKNDNCLAGGVFLTNLTKEHPEIVIQMISRQLGEMHPRAIADIAEAARKLNGPHNPLRDYFKAYIIDPISQLKYPYQLVVVLDGLEEWENHESFLPELAHLPSPSPVKFILTSRPSYSVERILIKIAIQRYPLPPVSQEIVERYFSHHFERIDWRGRKPDQLIINRLATHAQGLLIWAATVCSLLSHKFDERRPHEILERILWSEEKVGAQSGKQLARLYHGAISTLFPEDMRERLRNFLGAMMILQEPLPVGDFARLLGMPVHLTEGIQQQLAAFQTQGEFKSSVVPPAIQQFHFSFLEFMESPSTEYNGQSIAINNANAHSMLANRCIQIVFSEFLPSYRGTTCGYSDLRGVELYAIKFWPLHLSNGTSRLPLPSSPTAKDPMDIISEQDMRRWATLFLPCIAARFQDSHGYDSLDNTPRPSLPYQLAMIIGNNDVTTLSYRLHCLELAVRLEPINVSRWMALGSAYGHGGNVQNQDEEISIFRHALLLLPTPHPDHSMLLHNLATALSTRFQQGGASSDLDEAIAFLQEALLLRPVPHPDRSSSLNNLAIALQTRFRQRGASSDLDEAILFHQEALLCPLLHPARSMLLNNLAHALSTRFQQRGASSDLDEAIVFLQEALLLCPVPHPDRSLLLNDLATALLTRFLQRGASSDLDEAIVFYQEALLLCPVPHPDHSSSLNNLAHALHTRFLQRGASSDLDEAISFHEEALLLRPVPHPARSISLKNLAGALQTRFEHRSVSSDLDEAIVFFQEALLLQPVPHPDRSLLLNDLAAALLTRFLQRGASSDLDKAVLFLQEALLLRPVPHQNRSMLLHNLATALLVRFQHRGASSDLDEAISFHEEALLCPVSHLDRLMLLNNLARALSTRFQQRGASSDLDEGILFHQEALLLCPVSHLNRSTLLNNLALALFIRFQHRGVSSDLDEAIVFFQEAILLPPVPHPDHLMSLDSLASALFTRFEHQRISSDLDEAIVFLQEALLLRPVPHPARSMSLNNLASALQTRFEMQDTTNDREEVNLLRREAETLVL